MPKARAGVVPPASTRVLAPPPRAFATVLASISATAEVAGDAALLVDPHSVEAIRDGLQRMLADDGLRADLSKRGLARAAEFSWRRAADETHAVYERVIAGGGAGR